jgi:TonB-linked SusC/RagA family outer membrane protein
MTKLFNAKQIKIMKKCKTIHHAITQFPSMVKLLRIMKLSTILLLIATITVFAEDVYAQHTKLSLNLGEASVGQVLAEIENQSEFYFLFNQKLVDTERMVNVSLTDMNIRDILDQIFFETNTDYIVMEKQIVLSPEEYLAEAKAALQPRTISGIVTDENGEPLPGVNVVIKGTTSGTITNLEGLYKISVDDANTVLEISYVGYHKQEITVGDQSEINISLQVDAIGLEEVIVVGYGTQKKSDITGSVVSVNFDDVQETKQRVSVEQMLQGVAAGLNVTVNSSSAEGSSNTMLIRGTNSITASNNPLVILDGIPLSGKLQWRSITGREFTDNSYISGNLSEINPNDIESIEVLKDASAAAIYGSRGSNGVILVTSKQGTLGKMTVNYKGSYAFDQVINLPDMMDGATFYEAKVERGLTTLQTEDEGYASGRSIDWVKLATQTGKTQQHNLSLRGGSERTKYFLSMSYNNAKGIAVNDEFKRYTFRVNLDQKLLPWITFKTNTQYGYYDRSGIEADFERAFYKNPLGIPYNEDGSIKLRVWEDAIHWDNPLSPTLRDNSNITRRFTSNNSLLFEFPFLKGLNYLLNTGFDSRNSLNQTYSGRNTLRGVKNQGDLVLNNGYDEDWIVENILSYKQIFGKHSIFLTGLYSAQSEWREAHNLMAMGTPNDVMTYYQASQANLVEPSSSYNKRNHISQMFRANYAYNSRYLLTLTVRRDGYSAFGKDNKFGVFPSVAAGWNIASEKFAENFDQLNMLKLRLSYGVNGNEAISAYATLPTLSSVIPTMGEYKENTNYLDANDGILFGFYPNRLGDPTLGWEQTTSFNTGLDFAFFNNRLRGLVDIYWSSTTDLLLSKSISNVNGTGSIIQNIGETSNNGIEFQFSSVNVHTSNFMWTTDFNISHYNSKIVHVGLTDDEGNYIDDVDSRWFIGEPVNVNYHYVFDGIWQEDQAGTPQGDVTAGEIKYKDVDTDGVITPDDKQIIGRRIPDFVAGLNNTFKYKNWTFSFFLYSIVGITKANRLLTTVDNYLRTNRYNVTFWTPENMSNDYPRNGENADVNGLNMPFYRNADFLRLQDVSLSYRIPVGTVNKLKLNNVEVYANSRNLATWTSWVGLDPEFSNQAAVPQTATYLFGVKIGL